MSRPIFSRPRTRVYGCNYDKGESYYKPMVDHLDRKYSSRPLFSEPRTSFADEIAARRSDIGTRSLGASRLEDFFEDPDNCNEELADGETSATEEESSLKDFATSRRRAKERANEAFERDLEELRKRRRDMQDKMFDMIDMNAEMQIAKSCLEGANRAFMKHATKFDNSENQLDRQVVEQRGPTSEKSHQDRGIVEAERDSRAHRAPAFRWTRMEEIERDPAGLISGISNRRARIDSIPGDDVIAEEDEEQAVPRERTKRRPSFLKRKKSVSF